MQISKCKMCKSRLRNGLIVRMMKGSICLECFVNIIRGRVYFEDKEDAFKYLRRCEDVAILLNREKFK